MGSPVWIDSYGYEVVRLQGDGRLRKVHRLVVEEAIGRPLDRSEVVHHINGDKRDNRIENLEILSNSEHSREHGAGARRPWQEKRLPDEARIMYEQGASLARVAEAYGVCIPTARKWLAVIGTEIRPQPDNLRSEWRVAQ